MSYQEVKKKAEGNKLSRMQINQLLDAQNTQEKNVWWCGKAGNPFVHLFAFYFSR